MKSTTVIYHSADFDGIFCREIARKFLPMAKLVGWNFGDVPIELPDGYIYVLDLPPDEPFGFKFPVTPMELDHMDTSRWTWIDHHKSTIDRVADRPIIPGYRIDGVAACRLAFQWFASWNSARNPIADWYAKLPDRQDYVLRKVDEPLAVRLAGEYDIWDKRDPDAETFQYGLRATDLTDGVWKNLLDVQPSGVTGNIIGAGRYVQAYQQKIDADIVTHRSYRLQWEGLNWLVLNTGRFNSLTFAALDKPETGHDALLGYMFNGKVWTVSLYHAKHRTDLDLSQIAIKYKGGGHRGACGFTCQELPFHQA